MIILPPILNSHCALVCAVITLVSQNLPKAAEPPGPRFLAQSSPPAVGSEQQRHIVVETHPMANLPLKGDQSG